MSGHRLAVVVLSAAALLPGTVLHPAPAAASEAPVAAATKTHPTAHQRHVRHRHHLHVLHLLHLRSHPPAPRSSRSSSRSPAGIRGRIVAAAARYKGVPYSYGNMDCSGLTQRAYRAVGLHLPRMAKDQQRAARRVRSPLPGDLVFYGYPAYHVAIYIGGGKMIVARHTGTVVQEQKIWGDPSYGTMLT